MMSAARAPVEAGHHGVLDAERIQQRDHVGGNRRGLTISHGVG
jgi:hypothetical protein